MTLRNFIAVAALLCGAFVAGASVNVVPQPVSVEEHKGQFTLTPKTSIGYAGDLGEYAAYLDSVLLQSTGYDLKVVSGIAKADIALSVDSEAVGAPEGYRLEVSPSASVWSEPTREDCSMASRPCCSFSRKRSMPTVRSAIWSGPRHASASMMLPNAHGEA